MTFCTIFLTNLALFWARGAYHYLGNRPGLNSSLKCNTVDILGKGLKRGKPVEVFAGCKILV
jgi:hypothetical protein